MSCKEEMEKVNSAASSPGNHGMRTGVSFALSAMKVFSP
jgi:hypothetical protein